MSNNEQEPMGHISHLKNQFDSMNTFEQSYDYICHKIDPVVHGENILKFSSLYFLQFCYYLLVGKGMAFYLKKTEIFFT